MLLNSGIAPYHTAAVLNTRCVIIQATKQQLRRRRLRQLGPGGRALSKKKLYREASPYGPTPEPFIFDRKGPLSYNRLLSNGTPFTDLV